MNDFQRLTNEELNDFIQRAVVQLEPTLTQQVMSIVLELEEYRTKIENGTLVELNTIAKLFNRLWECPCDYIFDNKDVNEFICENVEEDWCEKNCSTDWNDYSKCWEVYLKAKLKELQGKHE